MALPLPWLSRYCYRCFLSSWSLFTQASRCCSQRSKASLTSSPNSGKMRSHPKGPGPRSPELAQAEDLLEQQLELYEALLEGQEGAWEAQALVLKIQKLKEQMRRHRESLGEDA
ncbi:mitochondrial coiled-coil domain protein 1 [Rhynchocyon petersi]